jgi:acyl carrier protein
MGLGLLDLVYRLEWKFGVKVSPDQLSKIAMRNDPPDINVGDLFEFIRGEVPQSGVLDRELDADALWPIYQCAISDALGTDLERITKDKRLIRDLGAG